MRRPAAAGGKDSLIAAVTEAQSSGQPGPSILKRPSRVTWSANVLIPPGGSDAATLQRKPAAADAAVDLEHEEGEEEEGQEEDEEEEEPEEAEEEEKVEEEDELEEAEEEEEPEEAEEEEEPEDAEEEEDEEEEEPPAKKPRSTLSPQF